MTEPEQCQPSSNHGVVESERDAKKISYYIQLIERMEGRKNHSRNEQLGEEAEPLKERKRHYISNSSNRRGSESSFSGKGHKSPHENSIEDSNTDEYPGKPGPKPHKPGKRGRPSLASVAAASASRGEMLVDYSPSQPSSSVGLRGSRRRRPGQQFTPTINSTATDNSGHQQTPVLVVTRRGRLPRSAMVTTVDQRADTLNEAAARNGTNNTAEGHHLQGNAELSTPTHNRRHAHAITHQQRQAKARETNSATSAAYSSLAKSSENTNEFPRTVWSSEAEAGSSGKTVGSPRKAKRVKHNYHIQNDDDDNVDHNVDDNVDHNDGHDHHPSPIEVSCCSNADADVEKGPHGLSSREVQFRDAFTALSEDYQLLLPPLPTTNEGMEKLVRTVTANLMLNAVSCLNNEKMLAILSG